MDLIPEVILKSIFIQYSNINSFSNLRLVSPTKLRTQLLYKMISNKIKYHLKYPISNGKCCVANCNRNRLICMSIFPSIYQRRMIQLYCTRCIRQYPQRILKYK